MKVYVILLLGVVGISFSAVLTRFSQAPASIIAFYRLSFTFLLTLPYALAFQRDHFKKLQGSHLVYGLVSGMFLAAHFLTWIKSLELTTVASSTVLVTLQPVYTMILGYFLYREKLSGLSMTGMLIAISGSVIMGVSDFHVNRAHLVGDLLALSGGFFASVYILIGRKLRATMPAATYCTLVYGACSLVLLIFNLVFTVPLRGYGATNLSLFLALAIICTLGGHSIFNWSLKHLEAVKVSTACLGEPLGATLLAFLLLQEIPGSLQLISGAVILAGLALFLRGSMK
ncbi:DMT family transporter [Anoxynatronum sibiricum]|uniref:DMT family transporter n=1 Tax=Anoxynatronum sibiricum TaxID=210623 RepID=A0ABU9VUK7_9CLOT